MKLGSSNVNSLPWQVQFFDNKRFIDGKNKRLLKGYTGILMAIPCFSDFNISLESDVG